MSGDPNSAKLLTYLTLHPAAEALSETFLRETNKSPAGLLEIETKHPSWLLLEFPWRLSHCFSLLKDALSYRKE